ncbi:MAG: sulfatase-like hydrolase/transferase [Planctomycetes bacterium]|nr:sulfatase-like hydrolase/transferase [Planctomycetota bacterium]
MSQKPNIVQVLVDDMGYGDFGVFSEGRTSTPVLDGLIDEGVCLTQHYSGSPICAPARAALLTGRYPHRTGAIETRELRGLCNMALRETTIADLLQRAGYATGLVGKWHNGCIGRKFHPNARGFDEFAGFRSGWQDYWEWTLDRNGSHEKSDGRYLTDVFTEEAVQFIRRHKDRPFFLHLAYNAPHTPLQAPEDEIKPFAETGKYCRGVSTIYAMVRRIDRGMERVLDVLKQLGLEDNTIVMYTSDNGPQFGGKGENSTVRFNCNFNGAKGNVYEGGIRVPMILRWPEGLDGGRRLDDMVHFCDWLPTLLAAVGMEVPQELKIDGENILPVLRGEGGCVPTKRFWQWNRYQPVVTSNAAMRDGDWKLVRPVIREASWTDPEEQKLDTAFRDEPWRDFDPITGPFPARELPNPSPPQLFNIANDPEEQCDLADEDPDRARRMLRELETWFEEVEAERAEIDIWPEGFNDYNE